MPAHVLIVDDHKATREGVRSLLSSRPEWQICGEAEDGLDAIDKAKTLRPDIVLMDISMPRMDGLDASRVIRREVPESKIVLVSQNDAAVVSRQAQEIDAAAFVLKSKLAQDLLPTLDRIAGRENATKAASPQTSSPLPSSDESDWLGGTGGVLGQLIRRHDWSRTPLGPIESWPQSLRTVVRVLLTSRFAMWMSWGPELTFLYNDDYARMTLGKKHPWALGRPSREVWKEIWDDIGPRIQKVLESEKATWDEALLLFLERSGYREETYHTFSYSPLSGDDGKVAGHLCVVTEETDRVIGERRQKTLRSLAGELSKTITEEDVIACVTRGLSDNQKDLPFTLIYLLAEDGNEARLACRTGVPKDHPAAPDTIPLNERDQPWPISELVNGKESVVVENLAERFGSFSSGFWDKPPSRALLLPITSPGQDKPAGVIVTALNPYRPVDVSYFGFINLVAGQVAASIANARAYEAERKRAEALAEIDRAKTAFFSNVSHEFRTPLTLMLGPLQDLLSRSQTHLSPTAKEQLDLVSRNGARLLRLVNTLLDFSRIEAGRVQAVYQATDLAGFTSELASVFRSATDKAGLRLIVDCRDLGEPVYVDRDMWEKIVLNLISNAFKFTFEGEIVVSVHRVENMAELRVRDTGVGIPAEAMPKLFERFNRIPNARSRTHEGSGIGLALVHELVKLHTGTIRAESSPGKGTTFIVRVPLGQDHLAASQMGGSRSSSSTAVGAKPFVEEAMRWLPDTSGEGDEVFSVADELLPIPAPSVSGAASRPRILVADDNSDMRQYLARLLAEHYEVETVADGQAATVAAHERRPDLIVSDVMMPILDGFELLRALRAEEETRRIPVILLSARAGEEARVEGLKAGADDYLIKPFSARELLARVSARLEIARLQRAGEERVAADLRAMTRLQELANRCMQSGYEFQKCLDEIVVTAVDLTGAEKGTLQLLDPGSGMLTLSAHRGFDQPFLEFFACVADRHSACGAAMASSDRVVVEDVARSDIFAGKPSLDVLREAGVRAVQSTPLMSSTGQLLGMISTHFPQPHQPAERELRLMDLLARQAADYLERKQSEEALRRRTEQFETLLNEAPLGVYLVDADLRIRAANPRALQVFGSADSVIGRDFNDWIHQRWHQERADEIIERFRHTLESGEPHIEAEWNQERLDLGIRQFYEWQTHRIPLPEGGYGVVCYFHDISAQVHAREAIAESEKWLRLATKAAELGIWHWYPEGDRSTWDNDRMYEIFGRTREDGPFSETEFTSKIVHPDDRDALHRSLLATLQSGARLFAEARIYRKDGACRWVEFTGQLERRNDGSTLCILGTVLDITERKQAEERERQMTAEARAATAKFRAVFEQTPVFAGIIKVDGTVMDANQLCLQACGYRAEEVLGKPFWETGWWRLSQEVQSKIRAATLQAAQGTPYRETLTYHWADGTERLVDFALHPIVDSQGQILFLHPTGVDITDLKRAEENYRRLAETLDAEVRLRTSELEQRNVDVIRQSEQLRDLSSRLLRTQDEERRRIARELHDSAGQLLTALAITLTRITQNAGSSAAPLAKDADDSQRLVQQLTQEIRTMSYLLHPPLLDEAGLADAVTWYTQGLMERSGLNITLEVAKDFGRLPRDMELVMFRVVQECLTNIHRHSGSKSALIRILRERESIVLSISDEGQGISPERLSQIQSQGSGVGITGMRERVRQFGGQMHLESDRSGTRVSVKFPHLELEDAAAENNLQAVPAAE